MDTVVEEQERSTEQEIKRKDHFVGTVTKITLGGAVFDIGLDKPGFVHIARLREEPTYRVEDVLQVGQTAEVWVLRPNRDKSYIELSMIPPLPLEWREIKKGMTVKGQVTRIEKFGVFVEIGAERPGLIHISELSHEYVRNPHEVVSVGAEVEAKVLNVNRRKKQIKLSIKALLEKPEASEKANSMMVEAEEAENEPVPSAMEMAFRLAMEKNQGDTGEAPSDHDSQKQVTNDELDSLLTRTLENYVPPQ